MSGQVLRVWFDLICCECYDVLNLNVSSDDFESERFLEGSEPVWCKKCNDYVFPISIQKREYNTHLEVPKGCYRIERDTPHGEEIIYIGGIGINKNLEPFRVVLPNPSGLTIKGSPTSRRKK